MVMVSDKSFYAGESGPSVRSGAWASMRSHLVRGEVNLDGGVSTRVEDLTSDNLGDSHFVCYQKVMGVVGG